MADSYWLKSLTVIGASMLITCITVYVIGVTKTERKHAIEIVTGFLRKKKDDRQ